ncbi:MAG: glycosyltransferase family 2 protein [Ilumatobacteraceae bacterium]
MTQRPIFIVVRDLLSPLQQLLAWLERAGHERVILIDNASAYPAMVDFLSSTSHLVVRCGWNMGHRSPWLSGAVFDFAHDEQYVVTDPDIVPDDACPLDAIDHFAEVMAAHPEVHRVGFGLRIDDLPDHYAPKPDVIAWESPFWRQEIAPGLFSAPIDTTFALSRVARPSSMPSIRTGPPYVARHLPWYDDSASPTDEMTYYREHGDRSLTHWTRPTIPGRERLLLDRQIAER